MGKNMKITRRDLCAITIGIFLGALPAIGGCYIWHLINNASSPQAIIDTSQNGDFSVKYRDGKPIELIFKPVAPEKVKK